MGENPAKAWSATTMGASVDGKPNVGELYMLMEEEHDPRGDGQGTFRDAAIEHAGHIREVTGAAATVRGFNALYVQGYIKK